MTSHSEGCTLSAKSTSGAHSTSSSFGSTTRPPQGPSSATAACVRIMPKPYMARTGQALGWLILQPLFGCSATPEGCGGSVIRTPDTASKARRIRPSALGCTALCQLTSGYSSAQAARNSLMEGSRRSPVPRTAAKCDSAPRAFIAVNCAWNDSRSAPAPA